MYEWYFFLYLVMSCTAAIRISTIKRKKNSKQQQHVIFCLVDCSCNMIYIFILVDNGKNVRLTSYHVYPPFGKTILLIFCHS